MKISEILKVTKFSGMANTTVVYCLNSLEGNDKFQLKSWENKIYFCPSHVQGPPWILSTSPRLRTLVLRQNIFY